jgi:hypothetical protein
MAPARADATIRVSGLVKREREREHVQAGPLLIPGQYIQLLELYFLCLFGRFHTHSWIADKKPSACRGRFDH